MIGEMRNHLILVLYKEMGKDFCPNFIQPLHENIDPRSLMRKTAQFKGRFYGEETCASTFSCAAAILVKALISLSRTTMPKMWRFIHTLQTEMFLLEAEAFKLVRAQIHG